MNGQCGHDIDFELEYYRRIERHFPITIVKNFDESGNKIVSYLTVCENCREKYENSGVVIYNDAEENEWLLS